METIYIKKCTTLYLDKFKQEWWDEIIKNSNDENFIMLMHNEMMKSIDEIFILLSKSALSGEYIKVNDFFNLLKSFKESLYIKDYGNITTSDTSIDSIKRLTNLFENINNSIDNALKVYAQLISRAKSQIEIKEESRNLFYHVQYQNSNKSILKDFIELVCPVCNFDYKCPEKGSNDFLKLIDIRFRCGEKLKKNNVSDNLKAIYNSLLIKTVFQLSKLRLKNFQYSSNFNSIKFVEDQTKLDKLNKFYKLERRPTALNKEYIENLIFQLKGECNLNSVWFLFY